MIDMMDFRRDGAVRLAGAATPMLATLWKLTIELPQARAGVRINGLSGFRSLLDGRSAACLAAARHLTGAGRPVRAIFFDKSAATNWSLCWHQDRTIAVQERVDVPGFGPWTVKGGVAHVAPPIEMLERMVTLRIHLDDVPANNAPLLIAPGSHRVGLIRESEIPATVARCGSHMCVASAGDIWLYSTPILHASDAAITPVHRRVLQIDYADFDLPDGLRWSGI